MTLENTELSAGARLSKEPCEDCEKYFVYYPVGLPDDPKTPPLRCPRCQDIRQERPSVAEERKEIAFYEAVEVINLPIEWREFHTGSNSDYSSYRIDVKGQRFGASWKGRIVIYADHPVVPGEVVNIREMEVSHRVKVKTEARSTLHYGTVTVEHELPVTGNEGEETLRKRRYLVLEPSTAKPKSRLVWATAYTKTTIKGLGRQFWSQIIGTPIAEWRIRGGYRSGRAYTDGVLAIVDADHPIVASTTGDYVGEKAYN